MIKYLGKTLVVTTTIMLSGNLAYAANEACTCLTNPVSSSAPIGTIVSTKGDVEFTGVSGLEKATSGTKLVNGSEVSVSSNGAANLSVGSSCKVPLGPNSVASISQSEGVNGPICVNVTNFYGAPGDNGGGGDNLIKGLTVAAFSLTPLAFTGGDDPISE